MIRLWYLLRNVYANIPSWIKSAGWFKRALGVLALIVVIALIAIGLSSLKVSTPRWFWEILGLLVLGVLVVLVFFRGLPWLDRRRFLRKQRGDLAPADAAEEIEPRKALEAAIREAEKRILNTPKSGGHSQTLSRAVVSCRRRRPVGAGRPPQRLNRTFAVSTSDKIDGR